MAEFEGLDDSELTPFYWSAGLITHPDFIQETRQYIDKKNMHKNIHLGILSNFSAWFLKRMMGVYVTLSSGQTYADVEMVVYKRPSKGLCLASFQNFNPHRCSFSEQPWMANISGVGIWSQSGSGSESFLSFDITNTHNPLIRQVGSLMVASYVAYVDHLFYFSMFNKIKHYYYYFRPSSLSSTLILGTLLKTSVRFFWPLPCFNEKVAFESKRDNGHDNPHFTVISDFSLMRNQLKSLDNKSKVWMAGRINESYIGVYCTQDTHMDYSDSKDSEFQVTCHNLLFCQIFTAVFVTPLFNIFLPPRCSCVCLICTLNNVVLHIR